MEEYTLFGEDASEKLEEQIKKLQLEISLNKKSLQNNINTFKNLEAYQNLKSQPKYVERINQLFKENLAYLDTCSWTFIKSFPGNCGEKIFELIMADFGRRNLGEKIIFKMRNHLCSSYNCVCVDSEPDFNIILAGADYFWECTTRNTSMLDKYAEEFKNFDKYYQVAEIFYNRYKEMQKNCPSYSDSQWHLQIENITYKLNDSEVKLVQNLLGEATREMVITKFKLWFYYLRYTHFYYKNLIPKILIKKLANIDFPQYFSKRFDLSSNPNIFFVTCIANKIVEKLDNDHFSNNPGILSISIARVENFICMQNGLLKCIEDNLLLEIKRLSANKQKIKKNIKHLYAIIIDPTWYNWFFDLIEHTGSMPARFDNCYGIIFNKNVNNNLCHEQLVNLFSSIIPYRMTLYLDLSD